MEALRVLYSFPLRIGTAGIGMTAWHQVTGLVHQGIRVYLYTGSCEKEIQGLEKLRETLVFSGFRLPIRLLGNKRAKTLHDKIVAKEIHKIQQQFSINIVHCWPSGAKETLKSASELGIKTVLERPNTHTRYAFEVVGRECARLGIRLPRSHSHAFDAYRLKREEEEFGLADRLLCPSQFVARTFLKMGFNKDKLSFHHYGFDPSHFTFCEGNSARSDNSQFRMVFVGSCEPRKGLHYALDAWLASKARHNGFFYICGRYLHDYRKLLAHKLTHSSVKEIGFLKDVSSLLRKCHVLVLPSIEEGSALVTYEARACGCVLLVSEASGAMCEHMKEGLVHKPGDVVSLRDHIDMLASDRKLLSRLRKNSLAGAGELTWQRAAQSLTTVYRECLNQTK